MPNIINNSNGIMFLNFSFEYKQTDYSDTYYTRDYYFEMIVGVSDWWSSIMKNYQDVTDTFENIFDKRPDEKHFICDSVIIASGDCCFMDRDEASYKLQQFLDK